MLQGNDKSDGNPFTFIDFVWWMVGISLLTFALFMSARMGIMQEVLYSKYGKHPREALFFTVSITQNDSISTVICHGFLKQKNCSMPSHCQDFCSSSQTSLII